MLFASGRYRQVLEVAENGTFIVVPAYEATTMEGLDAVVNDRATLLKALDKQEVTRFHHKYAPAQAATNYTRYPCACSGEIHIFRRAR